MADVNRGNRPLSPHATIYRWPLNAILSIGHRITGVAMTLAGLLIVWWFLAAATSPAYFALVDGLLTSWFGILIMVLSLFALWFHFCNGIRHLIWDMGYGMDNDDVSHTAWLTLAAAGLLTIITLVLA